MNSEMINLEGEAIGVIALIFMILSFLEKEDKKMFIFLAIGSFFYGIHFMYLGLITATLTNLVDVIKNLTVLRFKRKDYSDYIFGIFLILYITIGIQTANGEILNYMFVLATLISMFAAFYLDGLSLRICYFISISMQLIFTIIGNSISGTIINVIFLLSLTSTILFLIKRQTLSWKIKYYKIQFLKRFRKLFGLKYKRYRM